MADAQVSKTCSLNGCEGSIPSLGTYFIYIYIFTNFSNLTIINLMTKNNDPVVTKSVLQKELQKESMVTNLRFNELDNHEERLTKLENVVLAN